MKLKIKIKLLPGGKMPLSDNKGDLFDIYANEEVSLLAPQAGVQYQSNGEKYRDVSFHHALIGLGFAMEIPKGFKANLLPRSSTYGKYNLIFANSVGQIDNTYRGNNDEWKASVLALAHTNIRKGDRIAQFEIVPSSKATLWQKLKWLLTSGIEFVEVDDLGNEDRGGFGRGTGR